MQYANDKNGNRIEASQKIEAYCPGCKLLVIPKCGMINTWHFAHMTGDCDPWYEPESKWHRHWKELFHQNETEIVIGNHRADIKTNGMVIELQNSTISAAEIIEREKFYGNMIWIVNGESFYKNFHIRGKESYHSFTWNHARKCWKYARCPIWIDFGGTVFELKKLYIPNGWGYWKNHEELLEKYDLKRAIMKFRQFEAYEMIFKEENGLMMSGNKL